MYRAQLLIDILKKDRNNFDIFRLLAAVGVIIGHSYAIAPQPPLQDFVLKVLHFDYSGSLAVKFFFFLSGLLVTNSILKNSNPSYFLVKRALRIFPGLFICLVVAVVFVGPLFTKLPIGEYYLNKETWKYLFNNFLLMDLVWKLPGVFTESSLGLNGSLWTLPHEVLCYLYLAVFAGLGGVKNKIVSSSFFVLVILFSFIGSQYLPAFFLQTSDSQLLPGCFALGALFATNKNILSIGVTQAVLLWILFMLLRSSSVYQFLFYIAFFYSIILIASFPFVISNLKLPFDASYGVYIYGFMVQQCMHSVFPQMGVYGNQALSIIIALGMGILSWYLVEKKCIEWGNSFYNAKSSFNIKEIIKDLQLRIDRSIPTYWLKKNQALVFLVFIFLALLVHAIVLRFIFPGYYSPVTPQHSDFYIPAAFANAPGEYYSFKALLSWPRPIYLIVAKIFGYMGIQGGIACIIVLVTINCAFTFLLAKKILEIPLSLFLIALFALYSYLLFSHPFFYTFYSQDLGAQLSYFFLLTGTYCYHSLYRRSLLFANIALLCCSFLAFLSKETYGLTALFIALLWLYYQRKNSFLKATLPLIMIAISFVVAFAINVLFKSVFVDLKATKDAPYHISLNIVSVTREWFRYATESLNIANLAMIVFIGYLVFFKINAGKIKMSLLFIACVGGMILSIVPNAILPNHHYTGYSFNGSYIFYLPLVFLPVFWQQKAGNQWLLIASIVVCVISPAFNIAKYKGVNNTWVLIQETNQRNFLKAIGPLMKTIPATGNSQKILVKGITFPFHPFAYPESLRTFPNAKYATFDVVNYNPAFTNNQKNDLVTFISPSDSAMATYDQVWVFDNQGQLVSTENILMDKVLAASSDTTGLMKIDYNNLSEYAATGFYDSEAGIRWTNGNAAIELKNLEKWKDTVIVKLNTYMPPICKKVNPKLFLTDINNQDHVPTYTNRKDDTFNYLFIFNKGEKIKKLKILSETIDASPDKRILSFPFRDLLINEK